MSNRYALVPERVLIARTEGQITFRDVTVFAAIAMHADRNGTAFPGTKAIHELTGIHGDNVRKSIASLKAAELVEHIGGGFVGQNAIYRVATKASQNEPPIDPKGGSKNRQRRVQKKEKAGQNDPTQQQTTTKEQHMTSDFLAKYSNHPDKTLNNAERFGRSVEFQIWFELYPRDDKPNDAASAFPKAVKALAERFGNRDEALKYLLDRTLTFAPLGREKGRYCPYPANWLKSGGYDAVLEDGSNHSESPCKLPAEIEEVLL
ncbi:hypothetical protein EC9_51580 [Rosistilla ulvae]|uniref:Helix-turn-helix domain-containing protein n=1 Tax=Rosistilla ulvae TaxID=1930277 RepID=A0A517M7S8_9BACT|nr:hypothetical protein [Rosistilla ulvae]QDS90940.1 hypothetical protein EC9_51580 [Rosistilla ulvae]